jgi:hypothetical protein
MMSCEIGERQEMRVCHPTPRLAANELYKNNRGASAFNSPFVGFNARSAAGRRAASVRCDNQWNRCVHTALQLDTQIFAPTIVQQSAHSTMNDRAAK